MVPYIFIQCLPEERPSTSGAGKFGGTGVPDARKLQAPEETRKLMVNSMPSRRSILRI